MASFVSFTGYLGLYSTIKMFNDPEFLPIIILGKGLNIVFIILMFLFTLSGIGVLFLILPSKELKNHDEKDFIKTAIRNGYKFYIPNKVWNSYNDEFKTSTKKYATTEKTNEGVFLIYDQKLKEDQEYSKILTILKTIALIKIN